MAWIEKLDKNRFMVINLKRFDEIRDLRFRLGFADPNPQEAYELSHCLSNLVKEYEELTGKNMDQKYIVCNQDEPYAEEVARIILEGEEEKKRNKKIGLKDIEVMDTFRCKHCLKEFDSLQRCKVLLASGIMDEGPYCSDCAGEMQASEDRII